MCAQVLAKSRSQAALERRRSLSLTSKPPSASMLMQASAGINGSSTGSLQGLSRGQHQHHHSHQHHRRHSRQNSVSSQSSGGGGGGLALLQAQLAGSSSSPVPYSINQPSYGRLREAIERTTSSNSLQRGLSSGSLMQSQQQQPGQLVRTNTGGSLSAPSTPIRKRPSLGSGVGLVGNLQS